MSSTRTVTLVEYADFECPHSRLAAEAVARLRERFGSRLRFEFRHFPLTDIHEHAMSAAQAVEAAAAQGKFDEMHDLLFERQDALHPDDLVRYADELELDVRKFKQELHDGTYTDRIEKMHRSGERDGVEQTPTFLIDGVRFEGQWSLGALADAIERRLASDPVAA